MIEPKKVQFNIINETAEETSINLFNVNTLLDVPQSLVYEDSSVATISSDNLINSVINPINGDIFTYSNDNNVVSIYDSSLNFIQTISNIGSVGSGNRNAIIYIAFNNCILVNTDLGLYIIYCDTYTVNSICPIATPSYNSIQELLYDEFNGILYYLEDNVSGRIFTFNLTSLDDVTSSNYLLDRFNIVNPMSMSKATKQAYRYGLTYNQNYLQSIDIQQLNSGQYDNSLNQGTGFNRTSLTVTTAVLDVDNQIDGKIIAGGDFQLYNGASVNSLVRLNTDGSRDTSFNIGTGFTNNQVRKLKVLDDGKILCVGTFTLYNGLSASKIVRINSDGSRDTSFVVGTGFTGFAVNNLAIQPDGKILLTGDFTAYQGVGANRIIRLNTDGSRDTSFVIGTGFNAQGLAIKIRPNGKIVVIGDFTTFNGNTSNKIIQLNSDGSVDTSFNVGTGFSGGSVTYALEIQEDGKVIVGGSFTLYQGFAYNGLIRINTNGSIDTSFVIGTGINASGVINTISITKPYNKILLGGTFTSYNGTSAISILKLNTDGSVDSLFNSGTGILLNPFYTSASSLKVQKDGKILVAGNFYGYNGNTVRSLCRIFDDNIEGQPSYFSIVNSNLLGVDYLNTKSLFVYDIQNGYFSKNATLYSPISKFLSSYTYNSINDKIITIGTEYDETVFSYLYELNSTTYQVERSLYIYDLIPYQGIFEPTLNYFSESNILVLTNSVNIYIFNADNYEIILEFDFSTIGISQAVMDVKYSSVDNKLIFNCSQAGTDFFFIYLNDYSVSSVFNISDTTKFGCYSPLNNSFYFPSDSSDTVYVIDSSSESVSTTISIVGSIKIESQPIFCSSNNLIYVGSSVSNDGRISYINPNTNTVIFVDTNIGGYVSDVYSFAYDSVTNSIFVGGSQSTQQIIQISCVNPLTQTASYSPIKTTSTTYDNSGTFQGICTSSLNGYTYISSKSQNFVSVFNNQNKLVTTLTVSNPRWLLYVESLNVVFVISNSSIKSINCTTNTLLSEILLNDNLGNMVYNTFDNKLYVNGANSLFRINNDLSSFSQYSNPTLISYQNSKIAYNSQDNLIYINGNLNTNLYVFDCDTLSFTTTITNVVKMGTSLNLIYNPNNNYLYSVCSNNNAIEIYNCTTNSIVSINNYSGNLTTTNYNTVSVLLTPDNLLVFPQISGYLNFITFFDCSTNEILYSSPIKSSFTTEQANNFGGYINGLTFSESNDSINCFLGQNYNTSQFNYLESLVSISKTNVDYNDIVFSYMSGGNNYVSKMNSISGIYWNQIGSSNPVFYYSSASNILNKIIYNISNGYVYGSVQGQSEIVVINLLNSSILTTIPINIEGSVTDFAYNYIDNLLGISSSTTVVPPATSNGSFVVIDMSSNSVNQTLSTYNNYGINFVNFNVLTDSFSYGGVINSSYIASFTLASGYIISGGSVDYNFFVQGLNDNPKIIDQIDLIIPQEYSKNPINLQYKDANGISTLKPFFPNVEIDSFQKATNRSFVNFGKEYIMNINTEIVDFKLPPLSTIIFIITYQEFIKANLLDVEVYDEENKAKYLIKQNFNSGNVSAEKYWGSQSMPENFELSSVGWLSELKQKFEKVELLQQDLPKLENGTPEIRLVYKDLFGFKNEVKKRNISITEPLKQEVKPLKLVSKKEPLKPKIKKSVVSLKNKKQTEVKLSTKKQSVKPKTKKKKWLKVINIKK